MPRALVGEEVKNNALIFGYILLFPLVATTPSSHPLFLTPTWQDKCRRTYGYMDTIFHVCLLLYAYYLSYFFVCILFVCILFCMHIFILLFSFIKPFLQCTTSHQYYHLWLPEDETNLKLSGHFGIKAIRWSAGLGINRWVLSVALHLPLTLDIPVISVNFSIQHIFIKSHLGHLKVFLFIPLPCIEKDLSN